MSEPASFDYDALRTNRDLYAFIHRLTQTVQGDAPRSLPAYLAALWQLALPLRADVNLPLATFARLLAEAFGAPVPALDAKQMHAARANAKADQPMFAAWQQAVFNQLTDLAEMAVSGALAHPHRGLGVDAPSGRRWYNFDPAAYLECGCEGTFGGWHPDDNNGRMLVPGPVAILDASRELVTVAPADTLGEEYFDLPSITWQQFADFLCAGQCYE